jgi:acetyl esterase/lipase
VSPFLALLLLQPFAFEGAERVVYRSAPQAELAFHLVRPPARFEGPRPAVLFFFGGGWNTGTPAQFEPHARALAQRGIAGILVEYRVASRHKTTPYDSVDDAFAAWAYVRENAARLKLDPARIAASGGSAGGHLAACLGTLGRSSARPAALVLFNPAVDTAAGPSISARFGERARDVSPLHHVSSATPPTLILHGAADATVPIATVRQFCSAMKAVSRPCELAEYEGAGHGFFNANRENGKYYQATLARAIEFLAAAGF